MIPVMLPVAGSMARPAGRFVAAYLREWPAESVADTPQLTVAPSEFVLLPGLVTLTVAVVDPPMVQVKLWLTLVKILTLPVSVAVNVTEYGLLMLAMLSSVPEMTPVLMLIDRPEGR